MTTQPPTTDKVTPLDTYLRKQRDALLAQVRAIEEYLHIEPREKVVCPQCLRERNKAA